MRFRQSESPFASYIIYTLEFFTKFVYDASSGIVEKKNRVLHSVISGLTPKCRKIALSTATLQPHRVMSPQS